MALRLRRGTDAERQLITPAEGELIYTTDTKSVYIGDGVTVGGITISGEIGLGDLAEVDLSTPPTVGQVLKWDGAQFVPSDDLVGSGTVSGDGVIEGSNYRINIVGNDSSLIIDTSTNTITGNFSGDGNLLTNLDLQNNSIFNLGDVFALTPPDFGDLLIYDGFNFSPGKIRTIEGDDSSIMLSTVDNTFRGTFIGDGSGITNLNLFNNSIYELNGVFESRPAEVDDMLIFDGFNFVPRKIRTIEDQDGNLMLDTFDQSFRGTFIGDHQGNIFADDSSVVFNAAIGEFFGTLNGTLNGTVNGTLFGSVDGDVSGSIFADDSSIFYDAINQTVTTRTFFAPDDASIKRTTTGPFEFKIEGNNDTTALSIITNKTGGTLTGTFYSGKLFFGYNDDSGAAITSAMLGGEDAIYLVTNASGDFSTESSYFTLTEAGSVGIGTYTPTATLDVRGAIKPGIYANVAARDLAITSPTAGMMVFVTDSDGGGTPKFQGYDGTSWVNLN